MENYIVGGSPKINRIFASKGFTFNSEDSWNKFLKEKHTFNCSSNLFGEKEKKKASYVLDFILFSSFRASDDIVGYSYFSGTEDEINDFVNNVFIKHKEHFENLDTYKSKILIHKLNF